MIKRMISLIRNLLHLAIYSLEKEESRSNQLIEKQKKKSYSNCTNTCMKKSYMYFSLSFKYTAKTTCRFTFTHLNYLLFLTEMFALLCISASIFLLLLHFDGLLCLSSRALLFITAN